MKLSKSLFGGLVLTLALVSCGEEAAKKTAESETTATSEQAAEPVATKKYVVDTEKSIIKWTGSKPTEDHFGTLELGSSTIELSENGVVGGEVIANMESIKVTDIENEEYNTKLVNHLKNEDFFSVDSFPNAQFVITDAVANDSVMKVMGNLIIKGISNPAELNYELSSDSLGYTLTGMHTFDRTKYDIKYKSKTIFGDLGDKFILDDIKLEYNLVLKEVVSE